MVFGIIIILLMLCVPNFTKVMFMGLIGFLVYTMIFVDTRPREWRNGIVVYKDTQLPVEK